MEPYIGYIPSYSLFASIGLFFMMLVVYIRNKRLKFSMYLLLIGSIAAGAVIGSKVVFIITQIPDIIANFSIKYMFYKIVTSGFVFYGGLFGAILGCLIFAHVKKQDYMVLLNLLTPGFSLFHAFGRIGCFLAGCCYGKVAAWGVALWNEPGILRIPVQLMESVFLFFLTFLLLLIEKRRKNIFRIYLITYAVWRFIIEFFFFSSNCL